MENVLWLQGGACSGRLMKGKRLWN